MTENLSKAEQELVEKIAREISSAYFDVWDKLYEKQKDNWRQWVREEILPILKEAGYVKLDIPALNRIARGE